MVAVLLLALLFLVLFAGGGVFFWLRSLRTMQIREMEERVELRAKAEARKRADIQAQTQAETPAPRAP